VKYVIDRTHEILVKPQRPYTFTRYPGRGKYHWLLGTWMDNHRSVYFPIKVAREFACGRLCSAYSRHSEVPSMENTNDFCPKCLALYHKARFKSGE
jgi:hypothetical protein